MQCGQGHESTDRQYCSECGDLMPKSVSAAAEPVDSTAAASLSSAGAEKCPFCGELRETPTAQFCGTCGYDFINRVGGEVVAEQQNGPVAGDQVAASSALAGNAATDNGGTIETNSRLDFVFKTPGPPDALFSLFEDENLIGRSKKSVQQTVKLVTNDLGISSRQLIVARRADGTWTVRDVAGITTVFVNKGVLTPGTEHELKEGDLLEIGGESSITIVAIKS